MNEKGLVYPVVLVLAFMLFMCLTIGASITLQEKKYSQEIVQYYKVKTAAMLAVNKIEEHLKEFDSIASLGEMTYSSVSIQVESEDNGDLLIIHLSAVGAEGRKFPMTFVYNKEIKTLMDFHNS